MSQSLVHFVHLSGHAQLAHSAFSCCVGGKESAALYGRVLVGTIKERRSCY